MEQLINKLLSTLDSDELNYLPCFQNYPEQLRFQVGFDDGAQVRFYQETVDLYCLFIRDREKRHISFAIQPESEQFEKCRSIYKRISALYLNDRYKKLRDFSLQVMQVRLEKIISPVVAHLPEE